MSGTWKAEGLPDLPLSNLTAGLSSVAQTTPHTLSL
jgi:hypothetical protein